MRERLIPPAHTPCAIRYPGPADDWVRHTKARAATADVGGRYRYLRRFSFSSRARIMSVVSGRTFSSSSSCDGRVSGCQPWG
jgi:hypothetical protein